MLGGRRARRALLACLLLLCSVCEMDAFSVPAIQFSSRPQGRCKSVGTRSHHWTRTTQARRISAAGSAANEPFISELIKLANMTVHDSYKIMDDTNEGNSPRSASGGTTVQSPRDLPYSSVGQWADGGWVLSEHLPKLRQMVNDTMADRAQWTWLERSRQPFYIEVLRSDGVDITVIFVPPGGVTLPWRHTTGTLVTCKALFGEVELVQMLGDPHGRIPMRQATRTRVTDTELRYLGGPPRVVGHVGLPGEGGTALLEVALKSRAPMLGTGGLMRGFVQDATGYEGSPPMLRISIPGTRTETMLISREEEEERARAERARLAALAAKDAEEGSKPAWWTSPGGGVEALRAGVGGLDDQVRQIVRRAFLTRTLPPGTMRELGLNHVRGMLLYGPPGCGKTLIARLISESLTERPVKIVNGPELLDRWVGEAERNVRALFFDAEDEWINMGELSALHVIVLDELDALARRRGSLPGDSTGVRDSLVNQLLAKIDGVKDMENVLVIGLTNRMDLIDPALIRPGRLEVHVEVKEPNEEGRREILQLHMSGLESSKRLGKGAWEFADVLATEKNTGGYTGAELAGLVRNAASHAFERSMALGRGEAGIEVGIDDLERALGESAGAASGGRFKRTLKGLMGR